MEVVLAKFSRHVDAFFYVVGVAAISYQLATRGEDHWALAASFASGDAVASLKRFAASSPSLKLQREARVSRVEKLTRYYPRFVEHFDEYIRDLDALRSDVARALAASPNSKTVVFSAKMFYYAAKALGLQLDVPAGIPIPVDRRVCLISLLSRVVEGAEPTLRGARTLLSRAPGLVAKAWSYVGELSATPPLKLDALLWTLGGCYERHSSPELALDRALRLLSPPPGPALSLVRVLLGLNP